MVWPPSLSRDRKLPRQPIRRKTTHWMRVTPLAYEIEQSVMGQKMCFNDSYVIFGMRKKLNNFHYFSQKTQISLFPQCKTSIGNNSGPIKDESWSLHIAWGFQNGGSSGVTAIFVTWPEVTTPTDSAAIGVKQHLECVTACNRPGSRRRRLGRSKSSRFSSKSPPKFSTQVAAEF